MKLKLVRCFTDSTYNLDASDTYRAPPPYPTGTATTDQIPPQQQTFSKGVPPSVSLSLLLCISPYPLFPLLFILHCYCTQLTATCLSARSFSISCSICLSFSLHFSLFQPRSFPHLTHFPTSLIPPPHSPTSLLPPPHSFPTSLIRPPRSLPTLYCQLFLLLCYESITQ